MDYHQIYENAYTRLLLDKFISITLVPTICLPTRCTDNSQTLIHNIYISNINTKFNTDVLQNDLSNHYPISINFQSIKESVNKTTLKN